MPALDDLVAQWRALPEAKPTIALCEALGGLGGEALAREVGAHAQAEHAADAAVMLALGRMYARLGWLAEAQTALALSGKADGRDPRPFEELGHVLLVRGDARRAQQAFHRAIELGCTNAAVCEWLDASAGLCALQASDGAAAVQAELHARGLEWEDATTVRAAPSLDAPSLAAPAKGPSAADASEPFTVAGTQPVSASPSLDRVMAALMACGVAPQRVASTGRWEPAPARSAPNPAARVLLGAALASAVVLLGAHLFAERVEARRVARAKKEAAEFRRDLAAGRAGSVDERTLRLGRLFELDGSGSEVVAALLEDRAIGALWEGMAPPGLSDAVGRAEAAGVSGPRIAAGRIAARLAADDVEGAAELVRQHDAMAGDDVLYALVSGVALERVGDVRARERYLRATELHPGSVPARVFFARLSLLERGVDPSRRVLARLAADLGDGPITRTFARLVWALDADQRGAPPWPRLSDEERARLPRPLKFVENYVDAVLAVDRGERTTAAEQVANGLSVAAAPAELTALGMVAVQAGSEPLARRAATRVLALAPEYEGLPALAARIAMLNGRFADATRALGAGGPRREVALALAVDAYEHLDADGLGVALAALPDEAARDSNAAALRIMPAALAGAAPPEPEVLHDLGRLRDFWGDLVSVDCALDAGRIDVARTLVRSWDLRAGARAPHGVRLARLARITGKPAAAVEHARGALAAGDATPRAVVELVRALVETGDGAAARATLTNARARLAPDLFVWLDILVTMSEEGVRAATVLAARRELPPAELPLAVRALAVRALAEVADLRAPGVTDVLSRELPGHPDVVAARVLLEDR
ncbi:MAG: hypothetical protein JW751_21840 [Polyangiaceae bacterium]|nr:hypothetical protein [Polyangiaceae bacterium]